MLKLTYLKKIINRNYYLTLNPFSKKNKIIFQIQKRNKLNDKIMSVDVVTTTPTRTTCSDSSSNNDKQLKNLSTTDQSSTINKSGNKINDEISSLKLNGNGCIPSAAPNRIEESNGNDEYFCNYIELKSLCKEHVEFFKSDQSPKGQNLCTTFTNFIEKIEIAQDRVKKILDFASEYDFDEKTPGNGYRSFVRVTNLCIEYGLQISRNLMISRRKVFYRKGSYVKEIESVYQLLSSICTCLEYLFVLRDWSEKGDLFAKDVYTVEELFEKGEIINQYSFYGRCLGFQYRQSMQGALRFISICMASFSESYFSNGGRIAKTTSWVYGSKYFISPELRARRIVNISQNADINFCKSFWFLAESELMHMLPSIIGSTVKVNTVLEIPPEPLQMQTLQGKEVEIPVPSIHIGASPISVRLLSSQRRLGMIGSEGKTKNILPRSRNLIFHCHGGGFVAQSSKSHELYLRDWAVYLNSPILSLDYSLAPQAPFPRAIDEAFYAYCWALKNAKQLGTTAEKVVVCGDSAGANLCIGITLKCIQMGVRKPDGIFMAYCPTLVSFVPSPARMLCLMDPILPFGFMMRCLKAYAAPSSQTLQENSERVKQMQEIRNASAQNLQYSLANSQTDNSKWELIDKASEVCADEQQPISPFSGSDTFASASLHSQTGNTDLEDDSQPITHMPIIESNEPKQYTNKSDSEKYVDSFIEKYVDKSPNSNKLTINPTISKTPSEEDIILETSKEIISSDSIQSKLNSCVNSLSSTINKFIGSSKKIQSAQCSKHDLKKLNALIARSPTDEFIFDVPKDPLLSPYYAKDEDLEKFPTTKILTVDMDPCLDDCVMFGKKLRKLNVKVSLSILEGLPHGFLNFTMLSNDAMEGSRMCSSHIKDLLEENENEG